ncbi:hypothetical protein L3X38_018047 [Prunus dulcis]|uniref:Ubiquitin-like protease family profile domain-containing protein n=1 Tax=Prunus dulcis TaxID=3755 RepID=A0AAD4W8A1_PRUDU|nr:hypothetical protein L3X38_018047 [Prunus dulcis]
MVVYVLTLFDIVFEEMGSNVELVWPEAEAYSSRVNNCSHANSSLAALQAKLSAEQLEQFKTSCFGHLLNIDKIQFSGQIVHGAVLRRVAGQGVKDLDGLSFLLGCDVAQFTRQDFCLITGLRFGEVPEVSSGESDGIRLRERYFIDEGITCNALEEAFLRCTEEDDIYKLALVYFAELVVLGRDKHLNINLNYLTLVEDLDAFNRYPWGSVSFDKTQDSLFSAPTKYVKSFENEDGRGKGKSKVTGTSRRNEKGKKDKHGEAQRSGWSFKGFTYAFQNVEERQRKTSEGEQVQVKSSKGKKGQRQSSEGEEVKRTSSKVGKLQRKKREGKEVKRQRSEEKEVQRNQCEKEDNEVMLLGDDIGESTEGTQLEFSIRDIDLDQHTAVLSKLNVWLNHNGKASAQGVQLRKRKRIIPKWKIIEASELVPKTAAQTTGLKTLDSMKVIPHDDLVNLLKLCWEWRQDPNLVMQFGNVEAEIEFLASLVKADGWLKGDVSVIDYAFVLMSIDYEIDKKNMLQHLDLGLYLMRKRQQQLEEVEIADWTTTDVFFMNHISTCFAENKRKKQQVGWKIRKSLLNVVNGKVPPCGLDWQNVYTVYTPFMLTKYKHWVAVMIDLVLCEIKVYDSKVSLIPDDIIKEELAPLSITLPNLLNTMDFYEEGVYANNCSRDWWCPWPIERVDVPQQSNE